MLTTHSLFSDPPDSPEGECFSTLVEKRGLRIEGIHSRGQASPEGFWYDQSEDEWVLLARGWATLEVEGQDPISLQAGDCLNIPSHLKHRVAAASHDAVWLAVHHELRSEHEGIDQ